MDTRLGHLELQFLSWAQHKRKRIVTAPAVSEALGLNSNQERSLLSRLANGGTIIRLRKGTYLVPEMIPPGGRWGPNHLWVLDQLMTVCGATYQVSGPEAFFHWGLTDQVPTETFVYNTKLSGRKTIGGHVTQFVKVASKRLGMTTNVIVDGQKVPFATKARTIFDAIYDWEYFRSFPRVADWIRSESSGNPLWKQLVDCTVKFGNKVTIRRMGYILENAGAPPRILAPLRRSIVATTATAPLDPSRKKRGTFNSRWGLIINA